MIDLATLIVTLAGRVHDRKTTGTNARNTLRATLDVVEGLERNGVRRRVETICPERSLWIARELCDELQQDCTGAFHDVLAERRELVNSMGVDFPLR